MRSNVFWPMLILEPVLKVAEGVLHMPYLPLGGSPLSELGVLAALCLVIDELPGLRRRDTNISRFEVIDESVHPTAARIRVAADVRQINYGLPKPERWRGVG